MPTYWIIGSDGQTYGPSDLATVRRWVTEGRIVASTQVAETPDGPWRDATMVPELATAFGAEPEETPAAPAASVAAPAAPPTAPGAQVVPTDWPPTAVSVPQLVSGIFNLVVAAGWLFTCFGVILTIPLAILGIKELIAFSNARTSNPADYLESARTMAVLDICTVITGNFGSAICGIVMLTQVGAARERIPRR